MSDHSGVPRTPGSYAASDTSSENGASFVPSMSCKLVKEMGMFEASEEVCASRTLTVEELKVCCPTRGR